jgi:DNA-binding transcriptional regulator YiaG
MMTDEQKARITELKATVAATVTTQGGVPKEIRDEVVALRKTLQRSGTTSRVLARALGVHETTLSRWEREASEAAPRPARARSAGFRPVQLAAAKTKPPPRPSAATPALPARGLRVAHAPSGLVIDGLDVETLAALLRRLA